MAYDIRITEKSGQVAISNSASKIINVKLNDSIMFVINSKTKRCFIIKEIPDYDNYNFNLTGSDCVKFYNKKLTALLIKSLALPRLSKLYFKIVPSTHPKYLYEIIFIG